MRKIDFNATGRGTGETNGAFQGEDAGRTDLYGRIVADFAEFVETGRELLNLGGALKLHPDCGGLTRFGDQAITVIVFTVAIRREFCDRIIGQFDQAVEGPTGVVDAHRDCALDGQAVETDETGFTVGIDSIETATGRCRGTQLDDTERSILDQQANGSVDQIAILITDFITARHIAHEDFDIARTIQGFVADRLYSKVSLQGEEWWELDGGIENCKAHHILFTDTERDRYILSADTDGLVNSLTSIVDLKNDVTTGRCDTKIDIRGQTHDTGNPFGQDDETARPIREGNAIHSGIDICATDADSLLRRQPTRTIRIAQGDLFKGEIAT